MTQTNRREILQKLVWDYNIPFVEIEELIEGKRAMAGHLTRAKLFQRIIETLPWFSIIELLPLAEIKSLLEPELIKKLKSESLRKKYEFIFSRLQEYIPAAG